MGKVKEKYIGQFERTKSLFNFQRLGIMPLNWFIGTIALDGKCFSKSAQNCTSNKRNVNRQRNKINFNVNIVEETPLLTMM